MRASSIHRVGACAILLWGAGCGDDGGSQPTTTGAGASGGSTGGSNPGGAGGSGGEGATGGEGAQEVCAVDDGQCIFRHDTFGDEQFWTDTLLLHQLVETLPPTTALGVGLKVDAAAVPPDVLASADLEDPATTVALLSLNAVVGVRANVTEDMNVVSIGITCALCHSDVDDSVAPGIGQRLDGHPNRDLNPGLIISLTPGLADFAATRGLDPEVVTAAYASWGPGRYDARFNIDGVSAPVLIPPAYGLADVALETYTGEGPISYWNAYVAVTQMGGQGVFVDASTDIEIDIQHDPDLVTPKLPALAAYQHTLAAPAPPAGSFDAAAAAQGEAVFAANCASCHAGSSYTDAPTLHTPEEVGQDPLEAMRSKTNMYRTTPLAGAWSRAPYFHDGSAATLADVVTHYNTEMALGLTEPEQANLVQFLLSL